MSDHSVHYTSARTANGRDDWGTPIDLFERLDDEFGFGLDAAASAENALCEDYIGPGSTLGEDALAVPWGFKWQGRVPVWLNCPYSLLREFMAKAHAESLDGSTVVCLVPGRTDTRAWHQYAMKAAEIRLICGRLKFVGGKSCAPFPSAVVVFRLGHVGVPMLSAMDAKP